MAFFGKIFWVCGIALALAGNVRAAILSDDFSGAAGSPLVGSSLDVGGVWSNAQTDGSGTMGGNFLFQGGGGIILSNNNGASVYTAFNAGSYSATLTNGFTLSATFVAHGYDDLGFTLGLAETINKGYFQNLNTNDVIRLTYSDGGASAGTFKWGIYDGSVLLNNNSSTRDGIQTIHSNDTVRLSITVYPACGLIDGVATNLTGGYLLSRSRIVVNTPGLTNMLYAGMNLAPGTVTNSANPAVITSFSVMSADISASRPLLLATTLPPTMTGFAFQDMAGTNDAQFPYILSEHAPIDTMHAVRPTVYDVVRATYPEKIMIKQDAWGGTTSLDLGSIYPGHLLLKTGTKLTADCASTTNDTVLYVQDYTRIAASQTAINNITNTIESYVLLYALDTDGRPDWSQTEHVRLVAVDTGTGGITVKRAQLGSSALAFTNGQAAVARHMMFWTNPNGGQWQLNFSLQCPRGWPFNMTAAEWFALQMALKVYTEDADGIEFDVARWQWGYPSNNPMDCNNDLIADYGYMDGVNSFGLGGQLMLRRLRELLGPNKIIQMDGNDALYGQRGWQYANGVQMESFPKANKFHFFSEAFLHLRQWVNKVEALPAFSYPFSKTTTTLFGHVYDTDGSNVDCHFRVGFATALLTGMPHPFAGITDINFDPENPEANPPNLVEDKGYYKWDEYVGGTNDLNNWKWLGAPQGAASQVTNNVGSSNLLASTVWQWKTESNFVASCVISNGEYSATITQLPSNTIPWASSYYSGSQVPKAFWFGTRLEMSSGSPTIETNQEYTLEFEAKGNDSWNVNGQVIEKVPRSLTINGIADFGYNAPASVFLATNWTSYRFSMIAHTNTPPPLVFGFSEQIGNAAIRNIRLFKGGTERWVRQFANGIVLLNMTKEPWSYTMPTAYRRINGTQNPGINNGQRVPPTVTVPVWDALFLVRTPGTNIVVNAGTKETRQRRRGHRDHRHDQCHDENQLDQRERTRCP